MISTALMKNKDLLVTKNWLDSLPDVLKNFDMSDQRDRQKIRFIDEYYHFVAKNSDYFLHPNPSHNIRKFGELFNIKVSDLRNILKTPNRRGYVPGYFFENLYLEKIPEFIEGEFDVLYVTTGKRFRDRDKLRDEKLEELIKSVDDIKRRTEITMHQLRKTKDANSQ